MRYARNIILYFHCISSENKMASTNDPGLDKKRTITIDPSMYSITKKSRRTARNGNNNNNNNNNAS